MGSTRSAWKFLGSLAAGATIAVAVPGGQAPAAGPPSSRPVTAVVTSFTTAAPVARAGIITARLDRNPLRQVSHLVPERIDQGVDYSGSGRVFSLGTGKVIFRCDGCWAPGWYIAIRITAGRLRGRVWYFAESFTPWVRTGRRVTAGTVIGRMYGGIETGWADPRRIPNSMAMDSGEWGGGWTRWGAKMSWLLHRLGAPAGR